MCWDDEPPDSYRDEEARPVSRLLRALNASLPLVRVGGLWIRLHWSFFLAALVFAGWTARAGAGSASLPLLVAWGFAQAAILYALVLVHELSHVAVARMKGRRATEIVLTPLGGTAVIDGAMAGPAMEAEVTLAGPASNLLILGIMVAAFARGGLPDPWAGPLTLEAAVGFAFWVNLMLGLFNLIPAFPLDGGRVLRALVSWRKGERRGTYIACRIGEALSAVFIGVGIWRGGPGGWILGGIGVANIVSCEVMIRALKSGVSVYEEFLPASEVCGPTRRERRDERRRKKAAEMERRVDELLEKVAREGMRSLSLRERSFLRRASRHYRQTKP